MAYEHGTMDMSYDEDGKPHQFKAVMLNVYKAKGRGLRKGCGYDAATGRRPALTFRVPHLNVVLFDVRARSRRSRRGGIPRPRPP